MKRINVLAVAVCLLLGVQSFAQTETQTKLKSAQVYAYAKQIASVSNDQIWRGFDLIKYARLENEPSISQIVFSPELENPNNLVFARLSDEYFSNANLEDSLVITFHEAFHGFERDPKRIGGKWGAENSLLVFEYQETSARNNALFNIESRILYVALQSKNTGAMKQKLRQFLAIRGLRQSELDAHFVEFEKGAELNEGLAEYAGTKAVLVGIQAARRKQISIPFGFTDESAFLSRKFEMLDRITSVGKNVRRKFYYTGSAQAFLLDRLLPNWKTKVQMERSSLQELLENAVGQKKQSSQKIIDSALKQYNYEKILKEEEKSVAQRKEANQALLNSTLNQKGRRYVIDYSALNNPGGIRNFDPMNVVMITPKLRVHTRMVSFAAENSYKASFSQPVVEDLESRRYTTIVLENKSQSVLIDGEVLDLAKPTEKQFSKSLVITSANFKLEATAGTIKVMNQEIIVNLKGKP
jgi:hypothetical protein